MEKCLSPGEIHSALATLPLTLDDTYKRILKSLPPEYKSKTLQLLQLLTYSARPLSLKEAVDAIATEPGSSCPFDPEYRMPIPEEITRYCSSLVSLTKKTSENTEVQLAHFSVQEYLRSNRLADAEAEYLSQQAAAEAIVNLCLSYLLAVELPPALKELAERHPFTEPSLEPWSGIDALEESADVSDALNETRAVYPFAEFAARYWYTYAYILESSDRGVVELVRKYYSNQRAFTLGYLIDAPDDESSWGNYFTASPLYYASCVGLKHSVTMLLKMNANVNSYCGYCSSPLQVASIRGHTAIVRLLIQHGADVNMEGYGEYFTALQAAAALGNEDIVQMLIQQGADVRAIGREEHQRRCALHLAAEYGHESIVQMLIQSGADVNPNVAEDGKEMFLGGYLYANAVQAASGNGHQGIVETLLQNGADLNGKEGAEGSALTSASRAGHLAIVQLLLQNGADRTAPGSQYRNALQAASAMGHQDIVKFLLQNGADVDAKGGKYGSALMAAAYHGGIVQILIQNGVDVNAQGGHYGTALKAASCRGSQDIVEILIQNGADVNAQGGEYGTALLAASLAVNWNKRGSDNAGKIAAQKTVETLIQYGADINAQCGQYGNALQAASMAGHHGVVKVLLQNGADVNMQGGFYGTALQAASHRGLRKYSIRYPSDYSDDIGTMYREIVESLIQYGANVNAQCGHYGNALQAAREANFQSVVDILIKNGATLGADT